MSDLSLGGGRSLPENWGYPSPLYNYDTGTYDDGGMVWHGDDPATKQDKRAMKRHGACSQNGLDGYTLCGKDDPEYTTWREENMDEPEYNQHYVP